MPDWIKEVRGTVLGGLLLTMIIGLFAQFKKIGENEEKILQLEAALKKQSASTNNDVKEVENKLRGVEIKVDKEIEDIHRILSQHDITDDGLKLFVVGAHPDRNPYTLISSRKLETFSPSEYEILSKGLNSVEVSDSGEINMGAADAAFRHLVESKDISAQDLSAYLRIIEEPVDGLDLIINPNR